MSESKGSLRKYPRFLLLGIIAAVAAYFIGSNFHKFWYILMALIGFGTVILVHEFGHFVVAKLSDIKVEAFSIGFPPTFIGVRKTEDGLRFRILPKFFHKENDQSGDGFLSFVVGKSDKTWETEYRIGLVPFGGFVKMLGQDDIGPNKTSDDPRSYANKPVGTRAAVIAAGVIFNIISAIVTFVIVFLIGIHLTPPVIGAVEPLSPAAHAGLRPGDEIINVAGKSDNLDFMDVQMAAALSGKNEVIEMRVRHEDGSVEDFAITPKKLPGQKLKAFGIAPPYTLTVAPVSDSNALLAQTGLLPGDHIKAVNGIEVETHWQMQKIIAEAFAPTVTVVAERTGGPGKNELIESEIKLDLSFADKEVESESDLGHICTMVPRLRITAVLPRPVSAKDRLLGLFNKIGIGKTVADTTPGLQSRDIILSIGDVANPTYKEMRVITTEYENKELPIKVLRAGPDGEKSLTVTVVPRRAADGKRVVIGIGVALDAEHPVVAKTIDAERGLSALAIPRGAVITAVDGVSVSNFYDIAGQIRKNVGRHISIDYRLNETIAGDVALNVPAAEDFSSVETTFADFIPFRDLERLYKAGGPISAVLMGYRKTVVFTTQACLTLKRFFGGLISPKEFRGPVGIVTLGYKILTLKSLIYYVYILGLISAFISVLNSIPILPFDGGHIAFLLVEKIKGSPVNERIQGAIAYAGWVVVGGFALYVTFNDIVRDIVRSFFS